MAKSSREKRLPAGTTGLALTRHAWKRMCARSLSPRAVRAVLQYGRVIYTRGAEIYAIGRKEVARVARRDTDLARFLSRFEGLQVVCSPDHGDVLTVYRNHDFRSLKPRVRRRRKRR